MGRALPSRERYVVTHIENDRARFNVTSDEGDRHSSRTRLDSRRMRRADERQRVAPRAVDPVDEMMVFAQIALRHRIEARNANVAADRINRGINRTVVSIYQAKLWGQMWGLIDGPFNWSS